MVYNKLLLQEFIFKTQKGLKGAAQQLGQIYTYSVSLHLKELLLRLRNNTPTFEVLGPCVFWTLGRKLVPVSTTRAFTAPPPMGTRRPLSAHQHFCREISEEAQCVWATDP